MISPKDKTPEEIARELFTGWIFRLTNDYGADLLTRIEQAITAERSLSEFSEDEIWDLAHHYSDFVDENGIHCCDADKYDAFEAGFKACLEALRGK